MKVIILLLVIIKRTQYDETTLVLTRGQLPVLDDEATDGALAVIAWLPCYDDGSVGICAQLHRRHTRGVGQLYNT